MNTPLEHLSYSSISAYLLCARAWRYHYIDKIPTKPSAALVFGSAVHGAIESVVHANTVGEPIDVSSVWHAEWEQRMAKEPFESDGDNTPESLFNDGHRLLTDASVQSTLMNLRAKCDDQGPCIERRIELRVPGVPLPVIGFIDCILSDGTPVDFKTSARAWDSAKAQAETQPLFYLSALNQAGDTTHGYRFCHVVLVKTKKPQVQMLESQHTPNACFWLLDLAQHVWRGIEHGVFPCNSGSWKCGPTYCEYYSLCRGKL